ncbi:bidirectional sugar transporter SWEET17-like [Rutidosis leptorrhynchoides]|uniref:bidirectional sugar transporter SWEET17-like n=1 Tax=Rutidosis leptorrhynchoides TaxID=125765 RepID=UPI003A992491
MEGLTFFIGLIGNIISVLVFLSPVPTFWRIVKNKSTEDFECVPYVCTLLNSSLWTYYGIIKPGEYLVATVNGFGILVESIYVLLFLIYAPTMMRNKTGALFGALDLGFLAAVVLVTQLALKGEIRLDVLGVVCAGLNIIMYGSPLAAMKTVVSTKSVEFMPFWLSFFLFLNGGVWAFYAVLVRDYFLLVPNGIGFLLGAAQLLLYVIYRNSAKPKKNTASSGLEEQQREPLIISVD